MWLLLAIVFIVLGALLFAFQGFFGRFPDNWEWVGIVLAWVGIAMGVQPFTQGIWGKPKIDIDFETYTPNMQVRGLYVYIYNRPISNRILVLLGVDRSTAHITATYSIKDNRTNDLIQENIIAKMRTEGDRKIQISLNSSIMPADIPVVGIDKAGNTELDIGEGKSVILNPGSYEFTVTVRYSGKQSIAKRNFSVGSKAYELFWERTNFK